MKTYLLLFVLIGSVFPLDVFSQSAEEDTIYMKDGNVFTGKVSEQIRGVSYRIERAGGSILTVEACDIKKIKKQNGPSDFKYIHPRCKNTDVFPYKNKGFFSQAQIPFGDQIVGVKVFTGYKFDRFAQIGMGMGIEYAASIYEYGTVLAGGYVPIYFYYAGDILKKQFTPFYAIELGYPMVIQNHQVESDYYGTNYQHGNGKFMGSVGIGYKYYSWNGRFTCSLSFNADFIYASLHQWGTSNPFWGYPNYSASYTKTLDMIGFKFSIGY